MGRGPLVGRGGSTCSLNALFLNTVATTAAPQRQRSLQSSGCGHVKGAGHCGADFLNTTELRPGKLTRLKLKKALTLEGPVPHPPGDVSARRPAIGQGHGLVQSVTVQHETVVKTSSDYVHLEDKQM